MLLMEHHVFTPREVARTLRIDEETVRREIRRGRLEALQIGRQYRITSGDLVRWLGKDRFLELFAPIEALTSMIGAGGLDEAEAHELASKLVQRARQEAAQGSEARLVEGEVGKRSK